MSGNKQYSRVADVMVVSGSEEIQSRPNVSGLGPEHFGDRRKAFTVTVLHYSQTLAGLIHRSSAHRHSFARRFKLLISANALESDPICGVHWISGRACFFRRRPREPGGGA